MRLRELLSIGLCIVLCDVTLYRGSGFAGYALLFALAPCLLLIGSPRPHLRRSFWVVGGMLLLLAARMTWLGSGLALAAGFVLLVAVAMALAGQTPYLLSLFGYALQTCAGGCLGLVHYGQEIKRIDVRISRILGLNLFLPVAAIALFGMLFIMANPDLAKSFAERADWFFQFRYEWIVQLGLSVPEIVIWGVTGWVTIGLLRPLRFSSPDAATTQTLPAGETPAVEPAPLYPALRNMLLALIVLFAAYLVFEFNTLWFRQFPKGFYYAGYAHQGAAWLTAALALATVVLSLVFRDGILRDPRLPRLRRLGWIWTVENLILAATVYNRLWIYVGFNGMTRMRTVAIFGTSAVVAGLLLAVWKIARNRDFVWLVRRDLWALAIVIYLYAVTPVDALVHSYNVRRILAGDLAPSVQITEHPVDTEGMLVLQPLTHCADEIIREGIRAMFAQRAAQLDAYPAAPERRDWTAVQLEDERLREHLHALPDRWSDYSEPARRNAAIERFRSYAYQWY